MLEKGRDSRESISFQKSFSGGQQPTLLPLPEAWAMSSKGFVV